MKEELMKRLLYLAAVSLGAMLVLAGVAQAQTTDTTAPVATIDSGPLGEIVSLPDGSSRMIVDSSTATFTFHAETGTSEGPLEPDTTFECKLLSGEDATFVVLGG